mmetsp:Transcript_20418/g.28200  ORF Transcript_20418/g.28200 Transcript_20418/m.28200 type:complete len:80 (+) Transcript_20418:141-380(+)
MSQCDMTQWNSYDGKNITSGWLSFLLLLKQLIPFQFHSCIISIIFISNPSRSEKRKECSIRHDWRLVVNKNTYEEQRER